jgi:hypothetical protein
VNPVLEALFGNRTAAGVLLFLQCNGERHAQRIAKTFGCGLNMTQRQLKRLEEQGVLVSRHLGNMRLFSFIDRNPTVRNLRKLLEVELAALPEDDQQQYFRQRQRPRQSNLTRGTRCDHQSGTRSCRHSGNPIRWGRGLDLHQQSLPERRPQLREVSRYKQAGECRRGLGLREFRSVPLEFREKIVNAE